MSQISLAPVVTALAPLINALVMSVVGSAIIYAVALLHRKTGIDIDAANVDAIRKAAATEAGMLVAASETNLAGEKFTVSSPVVAAAAKTVMDALPAAIRATGLTPNGVAKIVAGELGRLQAAPTALTQPRND